MKRIILLCTIAFCFSAGGSTAQSYFNFIHIHDSTGVAHCQVPSTAIFNVSTYSTPDLGGISDTIHIFWGDGTDTTVTCNLSWEQLIILQVPHTYTAAGEYYTHGTAILSNGMVDSVYSTNPVVISTSCINLSGKVYFDENQNCTYDGNDFMADEALLDLVSSNDTVAHHYAYDGTYSFDAGANQNYTLQVGNIPAGMGALCPNSLNYNFNTDSVDLQIDFALICAATEPDNQIYYGSVNGSPPGFYDHVTAILVNAGCFPGSGTLTVVFDSLHQYISMDPGSTDSFPASVNGNIITFNFSGLVNFPYGNNHYSASIITLVNPNALPGDSFCIEIIITPADLDSTNNIKHMCGVIGGPFDPNLKRVSPLGTGIEAIVPPGTELTYTVEFQNTGNAPAIDVNVLDTLDTDFDPSTFQVIAASHLMSYTLNQNELDFSFPNIMLPDSGSDEAGSHGWVSYKIKPNSSAPLGTVVTNTASIYFDNNAPVLTNKTKNTFDDATGIASPVESEKLLAYPNPARDEIQFSLPEDFHGDIEIRNIIGNLILFEQVESSNFKLATNQFASGIYQLVARSGAQSYSVKFAVVK